MTGDSLEALRALALTDALTQIPNRAAFDADVRVAWERARHDGRPLALVMIDVDRFKAYNDRYGHVAGDACLRDVAQALQRTLRRTTDRIARYGGEEFVVLLPDADEAGAVALAETMRVAVTDLALPHDDSSLGVVSASFGVAVLTAEHTEPSHLVRDADAALYRAKAGGRNAVAVCGDAAPRTPPPVRARHHLPVVSHRLVGRADELDAARTATRPGALITIVGTAGVGKTRLALEVAYDLAPELRDGAWFVDLAALPRDATVALVAAAVAGTLALSARPGEDLQTAVATAVRERDALLVLDNAEHVLDATAALVAHVRSSASAARLLVTSRVALPALDGTVVTLEPLAVPPRDDDRTRRYPAVELFLARAADALPHRRPDDDLPLAAAHVARRLDGLPLALELAAARLAVLTPRELIDRLDDRLRVLRRARADDRHRGLDALLDWSVALLGAAAVTALRRLAIFPGSWTLAAAHAVCFDGGDEFEAMDVITELLDASLVFVEQDATVKRFRLLETTRAYAAARLDEAGERAAVAERHARWALGVAASFRACVASTPATVWLEAQLPHADDYRVALDWASAAPERWALEAALSVALVFFWTRRFFDLPAAIARLEALVATLETRDDVDPQLRADLAHALCQTLSMTARPDRVASLAQTCLARYRVLGDDVGIARSLALVGAGVITSDPGLAEASLREARDLARRCGERRVEGVAGRGLGRLAVQRGDYAAADAELREAIAVYEALGDPVGVAQVVCGMAYNAHARGEGELAVERGRAALAALGTTRADYERGWIIYNLATFETVAGSADDAKRYAREAIALLAPGGNDQLMRGAMETLAGHLLHDGDVERAVRLFAFANDGSFEGQWLNDVDRRWFGETLAALRAAAGPRFADWWNAGTALPRARAVALALDARNPPLG